MTLIDTSAWIEALRTDGDLEIRRAVSDLLSDGRAMLCDMVILELWNGARGKTERAQLQRIVDTLDTVPTTADAWSTAVKLARHCRERGVTIPATDLLISAVARHHRIELLHADRHFALLPTNDSSPE